MSLEGGREQALVVAKSVKSKVRRESGVPGTGSSFLGDRTLSTLLAGNREGMGGGGGADLPDFVVRQAPLLAAGYAMEMGVQD